MSWTGRIRTWVATLPLVPLLLIVAINAGTFALFSKVAGRVGADSGTDGYREIAQSIVRGDGFVFSTVKPSSFMTGDMKREPVYPLFLAGLLILTGSLGPAVLCVSQTTLGLVACCLLDGLGARVFDARTGRLAAYLYALHPVSFWYTTRFASEAIAVPAVLASLLLIDSFLEDPGRAKAFQVGLSIGVAALARSASVLLLPLVLLFSTLRARRKGPALVCAALVFCGFESLHALWLARNYALSGAIVPFTTMNGPTFFIGNRLVERFNPRTLTAGAEPETSVDTMWATVQSDLAAQEPGASRARLEAETDGRLMRMAREVVVTRPLFLVRKVATGAFLIWFVSDSTAKSLGWGLFQAPIVVGALVGLFRRRGWTPSLRLMAWLVGAWVLAYAAMSPYARYGLSIVPVLMLFAASAVFPSRTDPEAAPGAARR